MRFFDKDVWVLTMHMCIIVPLQVQVWDTQSSNSGQQQTMDPMLKISEGIEGNVERLSWDSTSKLLAAAVNNDVLVW